MERWSQNSRRGRVIKQNLQHNHILKSVCVCESVCVCVHVCTKAEEKTSGRNAHHPTIFKVVQFRGWDYRWLCSFSFYNFLNLIF